MLNASSAARATEWDGSLARPDVEFRFSDAAVNEARAFIRSRPDSPTVPDVAVSVRELPLLGADVERCCRRLDEAERLAVLPPVPGLDFRERRLFAWMVANLVGDPLIQTAEGDRLIAVYARESNRRVIDGARYHQTREGGGPHTDNVSMPDSWEYLVFSCIRAAMLGGESILINGFAVHRRLETKPEALHILRQPFWWEARGISRALFQAPVVTYSDTGEPRFRYLRKYLESAHQRAGEPLSADQVWALDVLEATLELSHLQFRTALRDGEILITCDSQVFHARTAFADPTAEGARDASEAAIRQMRFFDRVWARKRGRHALTS